MDIQISTVRGKSFTSNEMEKPVIELDELSLYAFAHFIRSTELLLLDLFGRGLLSGTTHTCLGQELCQMSVVRALNNSHDVVLSNHRNHGHFLTYSGQALSLLAEIMGRQEGVCGGQGGSQHLCFKNFHSHGVQAGLSAMGVGYGLNLKRRKCGGLVAIFLGDGTLGEGLLYESMNLAAVWNVQVLFVIENNGIAQTTPTESVLAGSIEGRGLAFGLRTWSFDDASPDFMEAVNQAVAEMRGGCGPGMLVIKTERLGPHSKGDDLRGLETLAAIQARDPLSALGRRLNKRDRDFVENINTVYLAEIQASALALPMAEFETIPTHNFRSLPPSAVPLQPKIATSVRLAINMALRSLLHYDEQVLLLGEDLHDPYGGAFKVTALLSTEFPGRVLSTPISEAAITGAGIGLSMAGWRPIVEIMFSDFLTLCMDQLYNHAVKFPGMFNDVAVPIVLRSPCGAGRGYGPTHSQSPENLLVSIPGLTVVYGSHRHNVGQLLVNAVTQWPNPLVFLEHKLLYALAQDPKDYQIMPPHDDDPGLHLFPILYRGESISDVTLVGFGGMLPVIEIAAEQLEREEELIVEIVAPCLLAPMPRITLVNWLLQRPRIVFVEESHHTFGVSAELVASLAEAGYSGKLIRVGLAPVPIPAARSLEREILPDANTVINRVLSLF